MTTEIDFIRTLFSIESNWRVPECALILFCFASPKHKYGDR